MEGFRWYHAVMVAGILYLVWKARKCGCSKGELRSKGGGEPSALRTGNDGDGSSTRLPMSGGRCGGLPVKAC